MINQWDNITSIGGCSSSSRCFLTGNDVLSYLNVKKVLNIFFEFKISQFCLIFLFIGKLYNRFYSPCMFIRWMENTCVFSIAH